MNKYIPERSRIKIHTDLVLELVDSFTQQHISKVVMKFTINNKEIRPAKYKDGLVVFCNLPEMPLTVQLDSPEFQKYSFELSDTEQSAYKNGHYIQRLIRLSPSKTYRIPKWATVIEGRIKQVEDAGKVRSLQIVSEKLVQRYRVKNYDAEDKTLEIHMTKNEIMEDRYFFSADSGIKDLFNLTEKVGESYRIEPADVTGVETHAALVEVKTIQVQSDGTFMCVLSQLSDPKSAVKFYLDKQKIGELQIESCKWNGVGYIDV